LTWLIDPTDRHFKIPANADAVDYIRRANSFAHFDLGRRRAARALSRGSSAPRGGGCLTA